MGGVRFGQQQKQRPRFFEACRLLNLVSIRPADPQPNPATELAVLALGENQTELAYAESWALTYFLRQQNRTGFDNLLRHYRASTSREEALTEPGALLIETLGTDLAQLDAQWQQFLGKL